MQNEDFFDYKGVKEVMGSLELKFSEFSELLKNINDYVNDNVNVSTDSAIYGILGADILDTWNQNASTFGDFYENFETWNQLIASIANSYASFEVDTVKNAFGANKSDGSKMAGVESSRIDAALRSGNSFVTEGATDIVENEDGSKVVTYSNGVVATYNFKENGEVTSLSIKNTDGSVSKRYLYSLGNSRINSYDKNGNMLSNVDYDVNGKIKFVRKYDLNGNVISATTYNEDGSVKEHNTFDGVQMTSR